MKAIVGITALAVGIGMCGVVTPPPATAAPGLSITAGVSDLSLASTRSRTKKKVSGSAGCCKRGA